MSANHPIPVDIKFHKKSAYLELVYADGERLELPCELLRVYSPSAEVRGHGKPVLQTGKRYVSIKNLELVGNYALKISFDDGHDTGLYDWHYLYELGVNQERYWQRYLEQLEAAGASRDPQFIDVTQL